MTRPLPPVQVVQNAYPVPDLAAACHRFAELYRVGPLFRSQPSRMRDALYRGLSSRSWWRPRWPWPGTSRSS